MVAYKLLLVIYDLLKSFGFLFHGSDSLHGTIMNAAHTYGKHIAASRSLHFIQALSPIALNSILIGDIVKGATLFDIPFANVIAKHRFTMGCSNNDTTTVAHGLSTRSEEKGLGARMHGRP